MPQLTGGGKVLPHERTYMPSHPNEAPLRPRLIHFRTWRGQPICLAAREHGRLPVMTSARALVTCPKCITKLHDADKPRDTHLAATIVETDRPTGVPHRFVRLEPGLWRVLEWDRKSKTFEARRTITVPARARDPEVLMAAYMAAYAEDAKVEGLLSLLGEHVADGNG